MECLTVIFGSLGAVLTPILITPVALALGWRAAFFCTGAIGVVWLVVWGFVSRAESVRTPPPAVSTERPRLRETRDAQRADRTLGAAREHDVGIVHRDHPGGVADRMGAGRAGGDDSMIGAFEAIFDRDMPRCEIDQAAGNEERRYLARAPLLQQQRGICNA